MSELKTQWRKGRGLTQLDFYLPPEEVSALAVRSGQQGTQEALWFIRRISTMLKAQPRDTVEMSADVVSESGLVLYNRVVRVVPGFYSAWDVQWVDAIAEKGLTVTLSCKPLGECERPPVFEALVRIWLERDIR